MSKNSKRTKDKKAIIKSKKKKQAKKLGMAKFIQKGGDNTKKSNVKRPIDTHNGELLEQNAPKKKSMMGIRSDEKGLSLVERCKLQMSSSLLRLMDEKLYQTHSNDVEMDREKFMAYHSAYEVVSEKWPNKPIDFIVRFIKKRLLAKRRNQIQKLKFADIGCGKEPLLKQKLSSKAKVQSFDLISTSEHVVQANMENLPVESGSIDCAVYSLSLMAKNLGKILIECKRILRLGGSVLIVEVTSRFEGREKKFIGKLERIGFKLKSTSVLKPNGYFTFFHFTKTDDDFEYNGTRLDIELKPCLYKAR